MTDHPDPTTPDDGGPAFPCDFPEHSQVGMSLRDFLAGQALAGLANANASGGPSDFAKFAYQIADAMLAERARRGGK